jgi:hypothetical protein
VKCKILGSMAGGIRGIIPDKLKGRIFRIICFSRFAYTIYFFIFTLILFSFILKQLALPFIYLYYYDNSGFS